MGGLKIPQIAQIEHRLARFAGFHYSADMKLLRPSEAAKFLGVSTSTIARWADQGRVEVTKLPSGHRRYVASSVEHLQKELRDVEPTGISFPQRSS